MNSIRIKLVSICAAVVLIVMSISGSFMLYNVRNTEIDRARSRLEHRARYVDEFIVQRLAPGQWMDEFDAWNIAPAGVYDIQVAVLGATGHPIVPFELRHLQFNDTAVIAALAGEPGFLVGSRGPGIDLTEHEWLVFALPTERDGVRYVVYARMNARPMNESLSQLTVSIVLMVLAALVITVVLWFLFASTLSGPIMALTKHAKEMARGHLDKAMPVHSRDEIGQLTESFNHMGQELNVMVSTLALEKSKHEAVLHNMTDGVLAYDTEGRIMHANSAAVALLQFDDMEQLRLGDMLPRLGFQPEAVFDMRPDAILEATLALEPRYIRVCCSPYTNQQGSVDGFVIVLQDITKHAKLDNMRREFVANVSHELRTPLSSVCSYAETLLGGALAEPETAERFLRVIDAEAKRMSHLVSDLLELSRLDDSPTALEREVVDLAGLTKMAVTQRVREAQEKQQRILFREPESPYFIEAEQSRMHQVLTNILSNSIKYSPPETDIEVALEETDRYYRVLIRDHGMGIAKEDLPRIFERFYRVDKARSRAMGGTGLGLAIAKEIMEAHGGRISVSSEPGAGTLMVLRFNKFIEG